MARMQIINNNQKIFQKYYMHLFGMIAFISTFLLGIIAFINQPHNLMKYLPYGVIIFVINIIYMKIIRLSRKDYEDKLKKEKEYSHQLLKSQKLFLRHAVHETNTPLTVIMANIELYELQLGKNATLSNIEAATKNIYGIYDDLSYLTKKDYIVYPLKNIVLVDFVRSRVQFFDIVARQSKVSLEIHQQCSEATIKINETKLQRIVDNNITNAIKYTKEHEIIHILVFEKEEHCIFEISSSSSLIKDTQKVFEAYYREDMNQEGLGLGLNLVKKICDKENINIELCSNDNLTAFRYYFKKGKNENLTTRR
jgi:signal transduction histidine kinase